MAGEPFGGDIIKLKGENSRWQRRILTAAAQGRRQPARLSAAPQQPISISCRRPAGMTLGFPITGRPAKNGYLQQDQSHPKRASQPGRLAMDSAPQHAAKRTIYG